MRIDLNADVGESWPRWESGEDVALLEFVTSANVCCGAYAGDEQLMQATCESAVAHGIAIGAQVGYPDREGFGRAAMTMPPAALRDEVVRQILLLTDIATSVGGTVAYVKPHGALYNAIDPRSRQGRASRRVAGIGILEHRRGIGCLDHPRGFRRPGVCLGGLARSPRAARRRSR